jgi:ankyrin repeat protein
MMPLGIPFAALLRRLLPGSVLLAGLPLAVLAQTFQETQQLLTAIANGQTETALRMLEDNPALARGYELGAKRPLLEAAKAGDLAVVQRLVALGADINRGGDTLSSAGMDITALHLAVQRNHRELCRWLLQAGADPNRMASGYDTPLHMALLERRDDLAGCLLEAGANPFLERLYSNDKTTPFELAIRVGDGRRAADILRQAQSGADSLKPEAKRLLDRAGPRLLAEAAKRGQVEAVEALLAAGVSPRGVILEGQPLGQVFALAVAQAALAKDFPAERFAGVRRQLEAQGMALDVFAATALGDLELTRSLVATHPALERARDPDGATPLHWAIRARQVPLTKYWITAGASLSAANRDGQTALHLAAELAAPEQVKLLLAAAAPVKAKDRKGRTPLDLATETQQPGIIRLLLPTRPAGGRESRGIATPAHAAAASGDLLGLDALLTPASLEARDELGRTPLHLAAQAGQLGAAALLLDRGAEVNADDPTGNTVLHLVLLNETHWIAGRPSPAWVARQARDPSKAPLLRPLLDPATVKEMPTAAQMTAFFLALGADLTAKNRRGQTPLDVATDEQTLLFPSDRQAVLALLLRGPGGLEIRDERGETALHRAARAPQSADGENPRHRDDFIALLLANGMEVNATNAQGQTPLHVLALSGGALRMLQAPALLDAGADVNRRDTQGRTPLHLLLTGPEQSSDLGELLSLLLERGADPLAVDRRGRTPLHYLASFGSRLALMNDLEPFLQAAKRSVNTADKAGDTPLHLAGWNGGGSVYEWLLDHDARRDVTNRAGKRPIIYRTRDE